MKKIIIPFGFIALCILLIMLSSINVKGQSGWTQYPTGTNMNLASVFFTDANTGYIVGDSETDTIYKTTNAGTTWTVQHSGTMYKLFSVYFTNSNTGYAVGDAGTIIKTTNAGISWTVQTSEVYNQLYSVYFTDLLTGYAVGYAGTILKTTNGGTDWTTQVSGTTNYLQSIYFTDANTGYVVGGNPGVSTILKTTNAGSTWTAQTSGTYDWLNSVFFTDANTGYIVGESGTILKTTNAGTNWITQISGTGNYLTSIYFTDANTGYAVGGTILKTINGGINWIMQTSNYNLFSVYFTDSNNGYAVGSQGTIIKTTTGGDIAPVITTQLQNTNVCFGQNISIPLTATGSSLNYKWQHNGIDIANSNASTLNITNATLADTGNYRCIVWNELSSDTSNSAKLKVIQLNINTGTDVSICQGESINLNVNCSSNYPTESGAFYHNWYGAGLNNYSINNPIASPSITTLYTDTVVDQMGCFAIFTENVIVQNVYADEEICLVTVDPVQNKNKIVWNKTQGVGTVTYNVYKEVYTNVFNWLGNVSADSVSVFSDITSNPLVTSAKYKISSIDSCGNESVKSSFHKTINLVISGSATTVGLSWQPYIDEGNSFIPSQYLIFRGTTPINLTLYDSVPGSNTNYNDIYAYTRFYYMVGVKRPGGCDPAAKTDYSISFSNQQDNGAFVGISDSQNSLTKMRVYPNPVKNELFVESDNTANQNLEILNIVGQSIYSIAVERKTVIDVSNMPSGIYFLKLSNNSNTVVGKFIKE